MSYTVCLGHWGPRNKSITELASFTDSVITYSIIPYISNLPY